MKEMEKIMENGHFWKLNLTSNLLTATVNWKTLSDNEIATKKGLQFFFSLDHI